MITPEAHLARILAAVEPLPPISVDLRVDADVVCGRVLAEDVVAAVPLPAFTNSAMDGYAVRAVDVMSAGTPLPVVGDIPAGDTRDLRLEAGTTWRIMTGAAVPDGADAIIPVEDSDGGTDVVRFSAAASEGRHLRYRGEDVQVGDVLLPAGLEMAPHHVAVLVSSGCSQVRVLPRPRVAVMSTGDELRPVGEPLTHGQIHDSNGPMLAALVRAAGAELHSVHHLVDEESAVAAALEAVTGEGGPDVVITTGGVSAGAFDVVKGALLAAGDVTFDKVAMQPGKPQGFGLVGARRVPVFTLPGNPMSTLVSFHVFVGPALARMAGRAWPEPERGVVAEGWRAAHGRAQYARVAVTRQEGGRLRIRPNSRQGSHHLGELAEATALAVVPADVDEVSVGDELAVIPLLRG